MPLLVEQERLIASEQNLINDTAEYADSTNASWAAIHDWGNIILGSAGILLIKFDAAIDVSGGSGNVRIKVGSYYVLTGDTNSTTFQTFGTAIWLPAGTYDIKAEGYLNGIGSTRNLYLENFQCGISVFNDQQGSAVQTYSSGLASSVPGRNTPVGPLKSVTYFVQVYAITSGGSTSLENIGDNFTNGVSILVDGAQVYWSERIGEEGQGGTSGKMAVSLQAGLTHTITISTRNGSTVVTITMIACPWILPSVPHTPVTISFSQGSTLYCTLEPLFTNPTKLVGVGAIHSISWGTVDDYYSSSSGKDLIPFSFMMDIEDILNNNLIAYGLGGCIGIIGVDAR